MLVFTVFVSFLAHLAAEEGFEDVTCPTLTTFLRMTLEKLRQPILHLISNFYLLLQLLLFKYLLLRKLQRVHILLYLSVHHEHGAGVDVVSLQKHYDAVYEYPLDQVLLVARFFWGQDHQLFHGEAHN